MYRIALLALCLLGACVADKPASGYRKADARIASSSSFSAGRFLGDWQVVAAFGPELACGGLAESWGVAEGRFVIKGTACAPGGKVAFATKGALIGPGRILRQMRTGPEELWVLWVDADYRVAAVGTPSGSFGRILARPGAARADLIAAAREVLDFNGYDTAQLRQMP